MRIKPGRSRAAIVEPMKSILLGLAVLLVTSAIFIGEVAAALART